MHLTVPLPERLSVTEAARIARAVSLAVEEACGFVVEPGLEKCEDQRMGQDITYTPVAGGWACDRCGAIVPREVEEVDWRARHATWHGLQLLAIQTEILKVLPRA